MFSIDRSMTAEIEYRHNRIKDTWPRTVKGRKGLKALPLPGRRLHAGSRPGLSGVGGNVATAR